MMPITQKPDSTQLERDVRNEYRFCLYRLEVIRRTQGRTALTDSVISRMRAVREAFPGYVADLVHDKVPGFDPVECGDHRV